MRCAYAIARAMRPLGIAVRNGLHTCEIEMKGEDVAGIAVHTAARVAALAGADEVVGSSTVRDLAVGLALRSSEMGSRTLKGLSDEVRLSSVDAGSGVYR